MKVLFIGSQGARAQNLNLDREVTELQRRASSTSGQPVEFVFLPSTSIEELAHELRQHRPDVLHLATHGSNQALAFRRRDHEEVHLTAEGLLSFMDARQRPSLVCINACNSEEIARVLVPHVAMAIGHTAPITNRAAREGVVVLYDRLIAGYSVSEAFATQRALVTSLEAGTSVSLFSASGVDPASTVLHRVPYLEADFEDKASPDRTGHYSFALRIVGCPSSTTQVIFFTDDDDFLDDDDDDDEWDYEGDLCIVVRGIPIGSGRTLTTYEDEPWRATGDFRLFAVGVTGDGTMFTASAMLTEALSRRYRGRMPSSVQRVIDDLLKANGAGDDPSVPVKPPRRPTTRARAIRAAHQKAKRK